MGPLGGVAVYLVAGLAVRVTPPCRIGARLVRLSVDQLSIRAHGGEKLFRRVKREGHALMLPDLCASLGWRGTSVKPVRRGSPTYSWRHATLSGRLTSGGGIDFRSTASLSAADGLARMHVVTNSAGKMELRVRWPTGGFATLATEP